MDGNPYDLLSAAARERFQADVSTLYEQFVAAVTEYRGLSPEAVRATEARVFLGQAGVAPGLADRIEMPDQAIARLRADIRGGGLTTTTMEPTGATVDRPQAPGSGAPRWPRPRRKPAPAIGERQLAAAVAAARTAGESGLRTGTVA